MNLFDILIHFLQIQTLQWSHNCVVFLCSFHQAALAVVIKRGGAHYLRKQLLCLTLVPEVFLEIFRRKSELSRLALSFATGIRVALSSLLGIFKDWP